MSLMRRLCDQRALKILATVLLEVNLARWCDNAFARRAFMMDFSAARKGQVLPIVGVVPAFTYGRMVALNELLLLTFPAQILVIGAVVGGD